MRSYNERRATVADWAMPRGPDLREALLGEPMYPLRLKKQVQVVPARLLTFAPQRHARASASTQTLSTPQPHTAMLPRPRTQPPLRATTLIRPWRGMPAGAPESHRTATLPGNRCGWGGRATESVCTTRWRDGQGAHSTGANFGEPSAATQHRHGPCRDGRHACPTPAICTRTELAHPTHTYSRTRTGTGLSHIRTGTWGLHYPATSAPGRTGGDWPVPCGCAGTAHGGSCRGRPCGAP